MRKSMVTSAGDPERIREAARILRDGGLVAFPTETVYGLGADAQNTRAVCRLFEVKKRPAFDPLIVHVTSQEAARPLWKDTPGMALSLMKAFWPGPLTIVLPKSEIIPDVVTAGLPTVAVRMPANEFALSLLREFGRPVAAPSANTFGYTSATTAAAVFEDLGAGIDLILDGGPTQVGVESTVLKIEKERCLLLRPGGITLEELRRITPVSFPKATGESVMESPGLFKSHYAPWTPLTLMDQPYSSFMPDLGERHDARQKKKIPWPRIGLLSFDQQAQHPAIETVEVLSARGDLTEAASNLFHVLRKLDRMNLDLIIAQTVPERGIGWAIMDRLRKASGGKVGIGGVLSLR